MKRTTLTIYKVDSLLSNEDIVKEFNEDRDEEDKKFIRKKNKEHSHFNYIDDYELYVRTAVTKPEWGGLLDNIVSDLGSIENSNNSFILFLRLHNHRFAVTAGQGFSVIQNHKDNRFGLDVVTRLIDSRENIIKSSKDRFIAGNILGETSRYIQEVSINRIVKIQQYIKELNIRLPSEIIENDLKVAITEGKEDYQLKAKDSIRLGRSLSLSDLDILLYRLTIVLEREGNFILNNIDLIEKSDPINQQLNSLLIDEIQNKILGESTNIAIIPSLEVSDKHVIKLRTKEADYQSEEDILKFIEEEVSFDKDKSDLIKIILQDIELFNNYEGERKDKKRLIDCIDVTVDYCGDKYWIMDGQWFVLNENYEQEVDEQFVRKVVESYNHDFLIEGILPWSEKKKETDYNFEHNSMDSVYVLDRILYKNLELCDLMYVENDKIYFIHVKKDLAGDTRVLCAQIEHAMQTISSGLSSDKSILNEYYNSIKAKLTGKDDKLIESANKFLERFPSFECFYDLLKSCDISFVFAYRPKPSNDISQPSTIKSLAAKISMIDLVENVNYMDRDLSLEFMELEYVEEEEEDEKELVDLSTTVN